MTRNAGESQAEAVATALVTLSAAALPAAVLLIAAGCTAMLSATIGVLPLNVLGVFIGAAFWR